MNVSPLNTTRTPDATAAATRAPLRPRVRQLVPFIAASAAIIVIGLIGLDELFYRHVSLRLNTEHRPLDRDFYAVTRPFWIAVRFTFAHALGIAIAYILTVSCHSRRWLAGNALILAVVAAALLANFAQAAIGRLRPNQAAHHLSFRPAFSALLDKQRVSFPSGEAATAAALGCALAWLFPNAKTVFYGIALLAAGTRLINGAHYLSDVAAGILLGGAIAAAIFHLVRRVHSNYLSA
jgi:membrane-associated phospholipid phosphatase